MGKAFGVGMSWKDGSYFVVIDGVKVARRFQSDVAALAYIDAIKGGK